MFALHETTQRRVCRVSFLVLCVVPTLLTLMGIAYCNRPWRQADWQRTLAGSLHVRADLENISRPRPGETLLSNLRLADLRTSLTLGSIGRVSLQQESERLVLWADRLELQADQLVDLATAFSTWLATSDAQLFELQADELTILGPSLQTVQLQRLTLRNELTDSHTQQFKLVAYDLAGKALDLNLGNAGAQLNLKLDTSQAPLPAWLLGKLVPGVAGCGDGMFTGTVAAASEDRNIRGKLQGTFDQVDLQHWIGPESHRLHGMAQVQMDELLWTDSGIESVVGRIEAQQGAASYSLLMALQNLFSCVPGNDLQMPSQVDLAALVPFDQLTLRFKMTNLGIVLSGSGTNRVLIANQAVPLMFAPQEGATIPVAQFVRLFHNPKQGWLPDTREAHEMSQGLPLPSKQTRESGTQLK